MCGGEILYVGAAITYVIAALICLASTMAQRANFRRMMEVMKAEFDVRFKFKPEPPTVEQLQRAQDMRNQSNW